MWQSSNTLFSLGTYYGCLYGVRVRAERAEMKKLTVGLALASAFAGSVFAADLPASMPVYAPRASVVPQLYSWTGCFIGPNVGGGWSGTTFKPGDKQCRHRVLWGRSGRVRLSIRLGRLRHPRNVRWNSRNQQQHLVPRSGPNGGQHYEPTMALDSNCTTRNCTSTHADGVFARRLRQDC